MNSETPEIELFSYAESPWIENHAAFYEGFHELFPQVMRANRDGERGTDAAVYSQDIGANATNFENAQNVSQAAHPEAETLRMGDEQWMQLLADESQKAEERGHGNGMEIGLSMGREEASRQFQAERDRLFGQAAALTESFSETRESYFHSVEQETAGLALAIAARILRREAQMDPLFLTGAVRVALGQLATSTAVRLRVPAQDQPMWEEALRLMPGLAIRPQVIGETSMELGDCRMETELGSADLGLWSQLKEIERGFFDRIGERNGLGGREAVMTEVGTVASPSAHPNAGTSSAGPNISPENKANGL